MSLNPKNTFYLSPDAKDTFQDDFDFSKANFIIGGLIDRTRVRNATLSHSSNLGLPSLRLPLVENCKEKVVRLELGIN